MKRLREQMVGGGGPKRDGFFKCFSGIDWRSGFPAQPPARVQRVCLGLRRASSNNRPPAVCNHNTLLSPPPTYSKKC